MPHVDCRRRRSTVYNTGIIQRFKDSMQTIRYVIPVWGMLGSGCLSPSTSSVLLCCKETCSRIQRWKPQWKTTPCWTRPSSKQNNPWSMRAMSSRLAAVHWLCSLRLCTDNLPGTLTQTVSPLKIHITTHMTTAESERCFSTLKRIKPFLRNITTQDYLNALAVLSMEKKLNIQ